MRRHRFAGMLLLVGAHVSLLVPFLSAAQTDGTDLGPAGPIGFSLRNSRRNAIVEAIERVRGAVVNIHSERTVHSPATDEIFSRGPTQNRVNGMGTGVIIDPRGYIVTNQHVVEDVNVIRVRLSDGATHSARVLTRDQESDLALLKIDASRPLPTMPM